MSAATQGASSIEWDGDDFGLTFPANLDLSETESSVLAAGIGESTISTPQDDVFSISVSDGSLTNAYGPPPAASTDPSSPGWPEVSDLDQSGDVPVAQAVASSVIPFGSPIQAGTNGQRSSPGIGLIVSAAPPGTAPYAPPTPTAPELPQEFTLADARSIPARIVERATVTADSVVQGNLASQDFGVDGAGIKIGIISDSFNNLGGEAEDVAQGYLPPSADLHILNDDTDPDERGTDEGRAIAQIVYSVAPSAQLYFYNSGDDQQSMATAITALQSAGCSIILDDIGFFDEPFFQIAGPLDAAINTFVTDGGTYFSAAGNDSNSFYQATFTSSNLTTPSSLGLTTGELRALASQNLSLSGTTFAVENFGTTASISDYEKIVVQPTYGDFITLEWQQPYDNTNTNQNDLRFFLLNGNDVVAVSDDELNLSNFEPVQNAFYDDPTNVAQTLELVVVQTGTQNPGTFKIIAEDDGIPAVEFETATGKADPNAGIGSGTANGHDVDPAAIVVGAAPLTDPTESELFSSTGPGELLFNSGGTLLTTAETLNAIDITGPDGETTSNNFPNDFPGTNSFTPFDGTSAATPVVAAVGALVMQENPSLTNTDIENILEDTATPVTASLSVALNSDQAGAGMVDALAAVTAASNLVFTESTTQLLLSGTHLDDTFVAGAGNHTLDGEGGSDTLDYLAATSGVSVNLATGLATNGYGGTDTLEGSSFLTVIGSDYADTLIAGADETLVAGTGRATLAGTTGGDVFYINNTNDLVEADVTASGNVLVVEPASLDLTGMAASLDGIDTLEGAQTATTFAVDQADIDSLAAATGSILGGSGFDRLIVSGSSIDFSGVSLSGIEVLQASTAQTTFTLQSDAASLDTILGGGGDMIVAGGNSLDLAGVTLSGIAQIVAGNDAMPATIVAPADGETISGGSGDDHLAISGGNDTDTLLAGPSDTLTGGTNGNTYVFGALADSGDTITNFSNGVDNLLFGAAFGSIQAVVLTGSAGPLGSPYLYFDAGEDQLHYVATNGSDTLIATVQPGATITLGDIAVGYPPPRSTVSQRPSSAD